MDVNGYEWISIWTCRRPFRGPGEEGIDTSQWRLIEASRDQLKPGQDRPRFSLATCSRKDRTGSAAAANQTRTLGARVASGTVAVLRYSPVRYLRVRKIK